MSFLDYVKTFILLLSITYSQSIYNSHGLGIMNSSYHSSSDGLGSIGLIPSFASKVSLNNPSTWSHLDFSYINTSFLSQSFELKNSNSNSLSSQFNGIQFLIPIRGKYAIGLTVKPINSHNTYMQTDTLHVQYYDDSINSFKEFRSGGGIMASNFAFTLPINAKMNIGFGYDNYFGSSRNEKSIILNDIYYRSLNIISYKGSKYNTYFSGEIFESDKLLISLYSGVGKTLRPISGYSYNFELFEDSDRNFVPSSNDFPSDAEVDTVHLENIYAPNDFNVGFNIDFKNSLNTYFEFQQWNDNAENMDFISLYNDQILSKNHIGIGLVKFGDLDAKDWQDKVTLRLGLYRKNYRYIMARNDVIENGLSIGFGIKFGNTGNQLDLSFKNGNRSSVDYFNESFREISVGISIGDVWFLRRRAKQ